GSTPTPAPSSCSTTPPGKASPTSWARPPPPPPPGRWSPSSSAPSPPARSSPPAPPRFPISDRRTLMTAFLTNEQADRVNFLAERLERARRVEDANLDHLGCIVAELATRLATTDDVDRMAGCLYHIRDAITERTEVDAEIDEVFSR